MVMHLTMKLLDVPLSIVLSKNMFENEYVMDSKRYSKWTAPKFYMLPIFYVYVAIFVLAVVAYFYFEKQGAENRWKTLAVFLMFISVYRGVCFKWMLSNKQYRVMKQRYFDNKPWNCKVVVSNRYIELYINGKSNNTVGWDEIKKLIEAKTFFILGTGNGREGVQLDKKCFTKGDAESFKQYILNEHKNITYEKEAAAYDR